MISYLFKVILTFEISSFEFNYRSKNRALGILPSSPFFHGPAAIYNVQQIQNYLALHGV
jgi:hypothetical protein